MLLQDNPKQKIGNLLIAITLSVVPTVITYSTLKMHGYNVCKNIFLREEFERSTITTLNECNIVSAKTTRSYIFLIGFFITLPTWLWINLSMSKVSKD